jgi:raffinose/stachyose/melibiose transport system substrate-binding protein
MINKNSSHKAEAAELLNFLVSPEAQQHLMQTVGPFPANTSVNETTLSPPVQRLGTLIANDGGFTWMHVDHALGPEIAEPFLEELQGVLAGTVTPEVAAATIEKAAVRSMGAVEN